MMSHIRKLLVGGAVAGAVLTGAAVPALAQDGLSGVTPFDVAASLACDGIISWSAQVGSEDLQQVWVKVDRLTTIALVNADVEGTYSGSGGGFDPSVAHNVEFRRLVGSDVEESVFINLTAGCDVVPTIVARTPAANATGIAVGANLSATFSEAMRATTVVAPNITLRVGTSPAGTPVARVVTYDAAAHVVTINPNANLTADTLYTVRLAGLTDVAGNALVARSWTFLTGPAPTVTVRTPAVKATAVGVAANVTATFSEVIVGLDTTTFTLRNTATSAVIAAVVTFNATTRVATLNPNANLAADTRYTATFTGGAAAIRDVAGNPLVTTSWTFLTGPPPTVIARTPVVNGTGVSRTTNKSATFNEAMDAATAIGANVTLRVGTDPAGALVTSAVTYDATTRTVTINPDATLAANTVYTISLTAGLTDAAGNPLTATSWSFTTGP